ncbi:hypothetical protein NQ317_001404 [Molorchus minor]|uniref:Uncharacterized protein n=1 Tax=Molorchus minor TaxID=1323400 RepID=A0ABQ9J6V5_9CUCU|nr:hypothetical protein NQ317_001404 [Molorchus minor]
METFMYAFMSNAQGSICIYMYMRHCWGELHYSRYLKDFVLSIQLKNSKNSGEHIFKYLLFDKVTQKSQSQSLKRAETFPMTSKT